MCILRDLKVFIKFYILGYWGFYLIFYFKIFNRYSNCFFDKYFVFVEIAVLKQILLFFITNFDA